jgi:hypothetical protein
MSMHIRLGKFTVQELSALMHAASAIDDPGMRAASLSRHFMGLAYKEKTLIGGKDIREELVFDLSGADCFTFIDYIEAMRLSESFEDSISYLKRVRYLNGEVQYLMRNHFFTDWAERNTLFVQDLTEEIGEGRCRTAVKTLNLKEDGLLFVPGIEPRQREFRYIPAGTIDDDLMRRLRTGDYAGIYSEIAGLDVSHTGIVIKENGNISLRHASSAQGVKKVVDRDLRSYLEDTPGLVVLRPKKQVGSGRPLP